EPARAVFRTDARLAALSSTATRAEAVRARGDTALVVPHAAFGGRSPRAGVGARVAGHGADLLAAPVPRAGLSGHGQAVRVALARRTERARQAHRAQHAEPAAVVLTPLSDPRARGATRKVGLSRLPAGVLAGHGADRPTAKARGAVLVVGTIARAEGVEIAFARTEAKEARGRGAILRT